MKSVIDQAIEKRVAKSLGARGGFAGRGAVKARTTEQARAAALEGWEKRRQATFERDEIARELAAENAELKRQLERIATLTIRLHDSPISLHEHLTAWARSFLPNDQGLAPRAKPEGCE